MTTTPPRNRPVVIELDDQPPITPDAAPPVAEAPGTAGDPPALAAPPGLRRPGLWGRLFRWAGSGLVALLLGVVLWQAIEMAVALNPWVGRIAGGLALVAGVALGVLAIREWAAVARLRRIGGLREAAMRAAGEDDLAAARALSGRLQALYRGRGDLAWALDAVRRDSAEAVDAAALIGALETRLMAPLDAAAEAEIAASARKVALLTAFVPLTLADVAAALWGSLGMIRRIAEIYGGRGGFFASLRLVRAVAVQLAAAGAVSIGDDMLGSLLGGSVMAKLSRRFGEGVINGALTVRVGVAAMEACRPLPFAERPRPQVAALVGRALGGLFGRG